MKYLNHITEAIGNTPLVKLNSVAKETKATILAKVEYMNPGNSVKDRMAIRMIEDAEIGGNYEAMAAQYISETGNKKPVVGFIAGQTAPAGRRMGHAGAIVGGADDTAAAKMKIMRENGIHVVESPAEIGEAMVAALQQAGITA